MFNIEGDTIALIGDTHQNTGWLTYAIRSLKKERPDVDTYIQLGDFGLGVGVQGASFLKKVNRALNEKQMFVLLGNHDDYTKYSTAKESVFSPSLRTLSEAKNVHFFNRQAFGTFGEQKILTIAGANSINKAYLQEETVKQGGVKLMKSWWAEEQITDTDVDVASSFGEADIMLSHDVPTQGFPLTPEEALEGLNLFGEDSVKYAEESGRQLQRVLENVKPKQVFHGHYHKRSTTETFITGTTSSVTFHSLGMDEDRKGNIVLLNSDGTVESYTVY